MSENILEQLKAAATEPDISLAEYKEARVEEKSTGNSTEPSYIDKPRPYEKDLVDTDEVKESEVPAKEDKEYKPWEEETKTDDVEEEDDDDVIVTDSDHKVPLKKHLKLKAQKKEREAELERYKAQLAEYESVIKKTLPKEEAEVVVDPIERKLNELKEPDPNAFDDWESYNKARHDYSNAVKELEEERIIRRVEDSFKQKALDEARYQEDNKRVMDFVAKVEEASKTNPEIKSAIGWFEKTMIAKGGLSSVDSKVREALTTDEYSPELIYRVVKDKDLVEQIFEKTNTVNVLKKIGKIAAYIELEKESDDETPTYSAPKKKVVPRTISGNSGGNAKSSDKAETMEEYKRLRAKEREQELRNRRR